MGLNLAVEEVFSANVDSYNYASSEYGDLFDSGSLSLKKANLFKIPTFCADSVKLPFKIFK